MWMVGLDVRWRFWEAGLLMAETDVIASLSPGLRSPCAQLMSGTHMIVVVTNDYG
jgi:hypothetical protein